MKKPKLKHPSEVNLLEFLERIEDRIPLTPEEAAEMLPPPEKTAARLRKLMAVVEDHEARHAEQRLELGRQAHEAAKRKIEEATVHRPRAENLAIVAQLKLSSGFDNVMAFHRNFESMSDADLDVLIADLQALQGLK